MAAVYGFEEITTRDIAELRSRGTLFRHSKTGAELLSLEADDSNKVFGITFRTPPPDSTGVAHILEHSVLCGSRKYPVKEPFVELLKGSLKTFLNAFTFPDKTCYPVASQNVKDFYNLIDVYLDAVFYPRITEQIFQQEGWHYELESERQLLTYKGVVYNEMKGVYSSPESLLSHFSQQYVFSGHVYGRDSGGDPQEIPQLTYEQFASFHRRYYHPSNSRLYFYGDDDPSERLRVADSYLKDFEPLAVDSSIPLCPHMKRPQRIVKPYPCGGSEEDRKKSLITVNWLLGDILDTDAHMALGVLEFMLLGMPASPLRKALLESGLGDAPAGIGLEDELRQMYFSTGMKGVDVENAPAVEALIEKTLTGLRDDGFDERTVEAAVNTLEFQLRENNTGRMPRGLILMLRALTTWLYDGDPFRTICFEEPLARLKSNISSRKNFFQEIIDRHFLGNPHRVTLELHPDPDMQHREAQKEKRRMESIRASFSSEKIQDVMRAEHELKKIQQAPDPPEALAAIPRLNLSDLDRENKRIPCELLEANGARVLYHDLFTSAICYADIGLNLHLLPENYLPYVPILGRALLETGTGKEDFVSLSQRIGRYTGGIRSTVFTSSVHNSTEAAAWLFLRAKAMVNRTGEMFSIIHDVFSGAQLDSRERLRQIVLEERATYEQRLIPSGHEIVAGRLRSHFDEAGWADEQMSGLSQLFFLRELADNFDARWESLQAALQDIMQILLDRSSMIVNITTDRESWGSAGPHVRSFIDSIPGRSAGPASWRFEADSRREGLAVPAMVNYVGKAADLYGLGYRYSGAVHVITHVLRMSWLWEKVRVEGGAYGAFCRFDRASGVLLFVTYRDPNVLYSIDIFDQAAQYLRAPHLTEDELVKSIIGVVGEMDAYMLPDTKGYVSLQRYLIGNTDELRQHMRDQVLCTSLSDIRGFSDVLSAFARNGIVAVLGSESALSEANAFRGDDFLTIVPVQ